MADAATNDAGTATDTGAADDATTTTVTTTAATSTDAGTDLAAEAEKWKTLSRKNEAAAKKAQAELVKAQQASMSEQEKAVAEAKAAGRAEAVAEIQAERVRDKVAIAAAGKLADPGDAAALLGDLEQFVVGGSIDSKAIDAAISDLLRQKPYLGVQPGAGSGEGGPRGGPSSTALNGDPLERDLKKKLGIA